MNSASRCSASSDVRKKSAYRGRGIPSSEALVTHSEKYIYWPHYNYEEYFDLIKDPLEVRNAITDGKAIKTGLMSLSSNVEETTEENIRKIAEGS